MITFLCKSPVTVLLGIMNVDILKKMIEDQVYTEQHSLNALKQIPLTNP